MIYFLLGLMFIGLAAAGYAVYALDQRLGSITAHFQTRLTHLNQDIETLHANQKTLEGDLKKVFGELQNAKKEVKRTK